MIAIGSKASALKNQLEQHVCKEYVASYFFLVRPLQQKTKTRKLEQCVIYLVLLSGDRRPVVSPQVFLSSFMNYIFFCSKTPCASLTFLKVHLKFHLGSGAAQEQKKWKTFIFSAFHCEGRQKERMQGEREVLKSVGERTCV